MLRLKSRALVQNGISTSWPHLLHKLSLAPVGPPSNHTAYPSTKSISTSPSQPFEPVVGCGWYGYRSWQQTNFSFFFCPTSFTSSLPAPPPVRFSLHLVMPDPTFLPDTPLPPRGILSPGDMTSSPQRVPSSQSICLLPWVQSRR